MAQCLTNVLLSFSTIHRLKSLSCRSIPAILMNDLKNSTSLSSFRSLSHHSSGLSYGSTKVNGYHRTQKQEIWISESINDEESLYAEVNRYVIKYYNVTEWESDEHKQSFGIVEKKTITTRCTITVQVIRRIISYQSETGSYKLDAHLADSSQ